ncbi:MAG: TonB-dependent receptor plug domain-containing protein [Gammaproteobacteria bacterium]|nr:TonB-dependent receptor plug domain-containing protein [Gammaproteobacteria bacterium]
MRKLHVVLLGSLLVFGPQFAFAADDEAIEEIVVTGSYLKRNAADSPSPLSVITAADIEDLGASDVAEIIQALPWSSGSQSRASTFSGEGADGRSSINLRNLGHGSTLPLVNGKRQVASWFNPRGNASVNVNGLIPNIALERVEIVKDGASALYGSDAIAGVVNFITKKDFEGFDFTYQYTTDDETKERDANTAAVIFGVQGDRGGIVASASFLNRDEINVDDRYDRFGGSTISSTGQPGRLIPLPGQDIIWAANGLRPGMAVDRTIDNPGLVFDNPAGFPVAQSNLPRAADGSSFGQADPACEASAALEQGGPVGTFGFGSENERCAYDFGSFFALQSEESLRKIHVTGHYDLMDNLEMYFEFATNDSQFDRLNSLNPNAPALTIPIDHPGTIEDARRRGIEPLLYSNVTRLQGGTRNTSSALRPLPTFTDTKRSDQRYLLGGVYDFQIGDNSSTFLTRHQIMIRRPLRFKIRYQPSSNWRSTVSAAQTAMLLTARLEKETSHSRLLVETLTRGTATTSTPSAATS